jgi:large subunit ribosomal protein L22
MTGTKTNERPGTRAQVKNVRMSATKARVVLDLVRNKSIGEASDVLTYTERGAAEVIGKLLDSAVANAEHNDQIDPETLFVSACYADEGRTMYRWRPRARGRATRIRKRTCHITIIVSAMSAEMLAVEQAKRESIPGSRAARRRGQEAADRAARVAASQDDHDHDHDDHDHDHDDHGHDAEAVAETAEAEGIVDQQAEGVAAVEEAETQSDETTDESVADAADEAAAVDATATVADEVDEAASDDTTGDDVVEEDDSDDEESK